MSSSDDDAYHKPQLIRSMCNVRKNLVGWLPTLLAHMYHIHNLYITLYDEQFVEWTHDNWQLLSTTNNIKFSGGCNKGFQAHLQA